MAQGGVGSGGNSWFERKDLRLPEPGSSPLYIERLRARIGLLSDQGHGVTTDMNEKHGRASV